MLNKVKYKITFIIILLSLTSCKLSKDLYVEWKPELVDAQKIEHSMEYIPNSSGSIGTLWLLLYKTKTFKKIPYELNDSMSVLLSPITKDEFQAKLISNNVNIDSLTLRGELVENYFSVNQNKSRILLPPIYWRNFNHKVLIAQLENGNLKLYSFGWNEGAILFIGGSGGGQANYNFEQR
jgi:hypothetical protein